MPSAETPKAMLGSQPLISGLHDQFFSWLVMLTLISWSEPWKVTVAPLIINKYLVGETLRDSVDILCLSKVFETL